MKNPGWRVVVFDQNTDANSAPQFQPDSEACAASKGGLIALTHSLAMSLGPDVRANNISPGWIDVRAWQANAPANPEALSATDHSQHPLWPRWHTGRCSGHGWLSGLSRSYLPCYAWVEEYSPL